MNLEECQQLNPDFCYRFKIRGKQRSVFGVPGGIVQTEGILYAGPSLRIEVWYRRHGWNRALHNLLVPLPMIESATPVEGGFGPSKPQQGAPTGERMAVVTTPGFRDLPLEIQERCCRLALQHIGPQRDFIVFRPGETGEPYPEDRGRTLVIPSPDLDRKVYAKLDDYRGTEDAALGNRWVVTLMLAEEW
jgi:hypothetical protein